MSGKNPELDGAACGSAAGADVELAEHRLDMVLPRAPAPVGSWARQWRVGAGQ